jgi:uncharacterized protein
MLTSLLLILTLPYAFAETGHITLLTVGENGNETFGGTANLYLEIKPGTGRVFIDSFPLTKVDTQISTRFAKEVACNFLETDCSNKDFFYTIRAKSSIVGGPSAGAAITVLTVSMLDNAPLNEKTVMTGTINSGGIIGPVAGIKEKSQAAKNAGFEKVLIPKWSIISSEEEIEQAFKENSTNMTLEYADSLKVEGVEIVTVSTLQDALREFTGKEYETYSQEIEIPKKYQDVMNKISNTLCDRYYEIMIDIPKDALDSKNFSVNKTKDSMQKANVSITKKDYYSAASYCFTANTVARTVQFSNVSNETLRNVRFETEQKVTTMLKNLDDMKLETISDLETYIIVKERLLESKNLLEGNESEVFQNLGYTYERMYSAVAWSAFFDYNEGEVVLNEEYLSDACLAKIAEAEERQSYLDLLFGEDARQGNEQIEEAKQSHKDKDYAYCLFKASKTKADLNAILTTVAVTREKLPELINDQLSLAKTQINKQGEKFPILGFSYYNYANSLKEDNPALATLFSEYAIELSNLDMYFPHKKKASIRINADFVENFAIGFGAGAIVAAILFLIFSKDKTKTEPKAKATTKSKQKSSKKRN